ncbi:hypothetical protein Pst134EA_029432 [Puccinia striiformis f. sp. tritici]|uniref:L-arabinokinase n=1 Tax=Puccinia striiformis f. sp. tritici PST-78 TaxID=1165861 RepID=A0A0L0VIU8_9BASI|nr:hypothetical protein Pst134EA_029432 [Puccinia striiformis f. sp. tritici]KAH9447394.1 hypothetical protein Pst134EA_029432 [Puccinia striiformis f. sp. tritici]KAI9624364.1 hypothetical protein KEM48_008946 [Puccinia striiformis f. sp. tritici PST-130]KNE98904.1 hypothetical protein PSTG_07750 [Puccinia striiformis f. sp. tritici PST-78]
MTNDGPSYHFAYYCSGHGFGHATRVVAITAGLISRRHRVSIVSSASESVFEDVVKDSHAQASYRFAIFEPTVVQPKAYDVDRLATFNNLHTFLSHQRQSVIEQEREWLLEQRVDCVIIDAPFLPCAAASQANIPSVIISNFTFDSCYSYLAAFDGEEGSQRSIETKKLNELVAITVDDYSKAELLLRLPGAIPIPGFDDHIELPATTWIDDRTGTFTAEIDCKLARPKESSTRKKKVIDMPLIVRPLTKSAYDPQSKLTLLSALGVPTDLLKAETKILLVSFGGQIIPSPRPPTSTDCPTSSPTQPPLSLLPPGWIAIICGLPPTSRPQDIPDGFFSIANSKFNYVPDLTAIADVVLGKLGYGTCSEVIATKTPFISVPRKMFVEEYGLKRLMKETNTINVEMSIKEFEDGRWASFILLADDLKKQQLQQIDHQESDLLTHFVNDNQNQKPVDVVIDHLENFLLQKTDSIKQSSS